MVIKHLLFEFLSGVHKKYLWSVIANKKELEQCKTEKQTYKYPNNSSKANHIS